MRDTISVRGCPISFDLRGSGPTLVWGHGLGSSIEAEDELGLLDFEHLRLGRRLLRYDARGHGRSGSTENGYHWQELALDQLELTNAIGVREYIAGGASMGCATALYAALAAPDRVRGLVLMTPPTAWASRSRQAKDYVRTADLLARGTVDLDVGPAPDPLARDDRWERQQARPLASADLTRLARSLRGAAAADLPPTHTLAKLTVRTLVLAWTGDLVHPLSTAARLHELMPHSELAVATTRPDLEQWTDRIDSFARNVRLPAVGS